MVFNLFLAVHYVNSFAEANQTFDSVQAARIASMVNPYE
jgi:hypothetical protein